MTSETKQTDEKSLVIFIDNANEALKNYLVTLRTNVFKIGNEVNDNGVPKTIGIAYAPNLDYRQMINADSKASVRLGFFDATTSSTMNDYQLTSLLAKNHQIPDDREIPIEALLDFDDFVKRYTDTIDIYRNVDKAKKANIVTDDEHATDTDKKLKQAKKVYDQIQKGSQAIDDKYAKKEESHEKVLTDDHMNKSNEKETPQFTMSDSTTDIVKPDMSVEKEKPVEMPDPIVTKPRENKHIYNQDNLLQIAANLFNQVPHRKLANFDNDVQELLGDRLIQVETEVQTAESNAIQEIAQNINGLDFVKLAQCSKIVDKYNQIVTEQNELLVKYARAVQDQRRQDEIIANAQAQKASNEEVQRANQRSADLQNTVNQLQAQIAQKSNELQETHKKLQEANTQLANTQNNLEESKKTITALSNEGANRESVVDQVQQLMRESQMQNQNLGFSNNRGSNNKWLYGLGIGIFVALVILIIVLLIK